jgi:hypothetical protein
MAQLPTNNHSDPTRKTKESTMPKIDHSIEINYCNSTHIWERQDPEKYISTTDIEIVGVSEDSEKPDIIIGKGQATRVRVGRAIDARESLFFIFDTDQGLVDAGCAIYQPDFQNFRALLRKRNLP